MWLVLVYRCVNQGAMTMGERCQSEQDALGQVREDRKELGSCLSQGFYSWTKTSWPRSKLGRKWFYSAYASILLFITKGSQDWNSSRSGSRNWCRSHEGMFFTGLLPLACSAYSLIEPKTTSPGMVPPTRGPYPLITNGSHGGISSTEAPFSVITLACVKLTPQTSQYKLTRRNPPLSKPVSLGELGSQWQV